MKQAESRACQTLKGRERQVGFKKSLGNRTKYQKDIGYVVNISFVF
jgi:hypothetical protein